MTVNDTIIDFCWKRGFNIKQHGMRVLADVIVKLADRTGLTDDDIQKLLEESANGSK